LVGWRVSVGVIGVKVGVNQRVSPGVIVRVGVLVLVRVSIGVLLEVAVSVTDGVGVSEAVGVSVTVELGVVVSVTTVGVIVGVKGTQPASTNKLIKNNNLFINFIFPRLCIITPSFNNLTCTSFTIACSVPLLNHQP
jgi:hypothetical protein